MSDDEPKRETRSIDEFEDGDTLIYHSGTVRRCQGPDCDEAAFMHAQHHSPAPTSVSEARERSNELFEKGGWVVDGCGDAYCGEHTDLAVSDDD